MAGARRVYAQAPAIPVIISARSSPLPSGMRRKLAVTLTMPTALTYLPHGTELCYAGGVGPDHVLL